MNKTTAFVILFFLVIFISFRVYIALNYNSPSQETPQTVQLEIPAAYSGTLPCASCPGIRFSLLIEPDSATTIRRYLDRDDRDFTQTSSWKQQGDTLQVGSTGSDDFLQFLIRPDTLLLLNRDGNRVESDSNLNYAITQSPEDKSIRRQHQTLKEEGVHWLASGNEPFWSIRLEKDRAMYSTPENQVQLELVNKTATDSTDRFQFESEELSVTVIAKDQFCTDSMSGFLFNQTVEVLFNGEETYHGCAKYL